MALLISESIESPVELVVENVEGKRQMFIEGVYLQSEIINRNRRKYPRDILGPEVHRYISEKVNTNRAVGELGHPSGPAINLDLISHRIVSLREDGNDWIGKSLLLNTPKGMIAQNLLEGGVQFGVSSRALGSLRPIQDKTGSYNTITEDFRIATAADIVYDPSAPNAFVNGLMEGVEWVIDSASGEFVEKARMRVNESIRQRNRETVALVLFEKFLNDAAKKRYT